MLRYNAHEMTTMIGMKASVHCIQLVFSFLVFLSCDKTMFNASSQGKESL